MGCWLDGLGIKFLKYIKPSLLIMRMEFYNSVGYTVFAYMCYPTKLYNMYVPWTLKLNVVWSTVAVQNPARSGRGDIDCNPIGRCRRAQFEGVTSCDGCVIGVALWECERCEGDGCTEETKRDKMTPATTNNSQIDSFVRKKVVTINV